MLLERLPAAYVKRDGETTLMTELDKAAEEVQSSTYRQPHYTEFVTKADPYWINFSSLVVRPQCYELFTSGRPLIAC